MNSLFLHNFNFRSFHQGFDNNTVDSLFVEGNKIRAIGRFNELQSLVQPHTQLINGQGKTISPGFNDTHIHIWKVGSLKTFVLDVRGASSINEMLQMLSDYGKQNQDAEWIQARGFNEASWKEGRLPSKDDLDQIINDRPVYLIRTCAHIAVCNTFALQTCGISAATKAPAGGFIYKGNDGKPNGIFAETALGLITRHIPAYTIPQLKKMVLAARDEMFRFGITAATDPAVDPLLLETYHEMNAANELNFRLSAMPIVIPDGGSEPYPLPDVFASPFMTVNTVKFFSDGGLSGKTAALKRHYKNTDELGVLRLQRAQYFQLSKDAMEKNFSIATHAIGDAAIEFVIDAYKSFSASFPHLQHRIEHLGLPEEKHLQDMAAYQIATSMQSIFIYELGKNFRKYIDDDYLNHCYPVRSVLEHGITMALSSDAPVVKNFNPLQGMATAIDRNDAEGNTVSATEGISTNEALTAYTSTAAKLCKIQTYGSLKEGMLADFIVLDNDPLICPDVASIKVEQTYIDGKLVFSSGK